MQITSFFGTVSYVTFPQVPNETKWIGFWNEHKPLWLSQHQGREQTESNLECYSVCQPLAHHATNWSHYFPEARPDVPLRASRILQLTVAGITHFNSPDYFLLLFFLSCHVFSQLSRKVVLGNLNLQQVVDLKDLLLLSLCQEPQTTMFSLLPNMAVCLVALQVCHCSYPSRIIYGGVPLVVV